MGHAPFNPPVQGQLVSVRQRHYVVSDVDKSTLPDGPFLIGASKVHLVTLASVEDDALGEEPQVVWELEPGAEVIENVALPEPTGCNARDRLDAFLDAVRWGAASTANRRSIQSPFRSGIVIEDYQLDPVVRAIRMRHGDLGIGDPSPGPPGAGRVPGCTSAAVEGADARQVRARIPHRGQHSDERAAPAAGHSRQPLDALPPAHHIHRLAFDPGRTRRSRVPATRTVYHARAGAVRAQRRQLLEIPQEIEKETEAIEARFADPQPRMFPVAVTILVPE